MTQPYAAAGRSLVSDRHAPAAVPGARTPRHGLTGAFAVAEVPGESPTAYLETGVQGITVRDPTLVSSAARMFDDLRDEALSRRRARP
ncbi:MAG: Scr1 family TA system antitoxin-like transcriptional regulator [Streptosporangiaceae bacterium]